MIGVIQKVLLLLLEEQGGPELRDRVLARAGLPVTTRFRINADYPDQDLLDLLAASQSETGLSRAELMERYAVHFIRYAEGLFPQLFRISSGVRDFLLRQPVIHASFAAGLRGAQAQQAVVDKFAVNDLEDGSLEVTYRSQNRLCDLYAALAGALASRYGETVQVEILQCARSCGSEACRLRTYWPDSQSARGDLRNCQSFGQQDE